MIEESIALKIVTQSYLRITVYFELFKVKLTSMVVLSSIFGYLLGASQYAFVPVFWLALGGFLLTSGSSAMNQVLEKNTDALMKRTANRPLPSGRITVVEAFIVSCISVALGLLILYVKFSFLSFALGLMAFISYCFIYTPLKKVSNFSVFVGAFPGAVPPMLGWVAGTGSFGIIPGVLFAVQFAWQFPHFWSIAWRLNKDYKRGGLKMLPFNIISRKTAWVILSSVVALSLITPLLGRVTFSSFLATFFITLLTGPILYNSLRLLITMKEKYSLRIMLFSYLYLIISLLVLFIDKIYKETLG